MKSSKYWKKRMTALEDGQYQKSAAYYQNVQEQYQKAINKTVMDIERWYQRLADNNGISLAAAKKLLKKNELDEFHWSVEQYIKAGKENALDQRWMKELENASAKHHISYLQAMKLQMRQHAEWLSAEFEGGLTAFLHKSYGEQYYRTAFEIAKGTEVGSNLARLDTRKIELLLKKPWTQDGKNFSDRIWAQKDKMVSRLHTELTQNIIRGAPPNKAIESISKAMNVSRQQAGRLVMTESAAVSSRAQQDCFKELGVEEFEVVVTFDHITCDLCQEMDRKHFPMSHFYIGETAPPFHPNCRCCTIPFFDNDFGRTGKRAARDEKTGKTYYVPGDMTYKDWKKEFLKGSKKAILDVEKDSDFGIIKLSEEELGVLQKYKSFESYLINEALRTSDSIDDLSLIQQSFVKRLDAALSKIPQYSGNLIRTVDFSDWPDCAERTEKFANEFVVGKSIQIKQYWSTSKELGYNNHAGIQIFVQDSQKGKDISKIGLDEREVLYERKSEFIVVSKMLYNGIWNILLQEV